MTTNTAKSVGTWIIGVLLIGAVVFDGIQVFQGYVPVSFEWRAVFLLILIGGIVLRLRYFRSPRFIPVGLLLLFMNIVFLFVLMDQHVHH